LSAVAVVDDLQFSPLLSAQAACASSSAGDHGAVKLLEMDLLQLFFPCILCSKMPSCQLPPPPMRTSGYPAARLPLPSPIHLYACSGVLHSSLQAVWRNGQASPWASHCPRAERAGFIDSPLDIAGVLCGAEPLVVLCAPLLYAMQVGAEAEAQCDPQGCADWDARVAQAVQANNTAWWVVRFCGLLNIACRPDCLWGPAVH
jgi:hypothetical protein